MNFINAFIFLTLHIFFIQNSNVILGQKVDCPSARKEYVENYPEILNSKNFDGNPWLHYKEIGQLEGKHWQSDACLVAVLEEICASTIPFEYDLENNNAILNELAEYVNYQNQLKEFDYYLNYKGFNLSFTTGSDRFTRYHDAGSVLYGATKMLKNKCDIYVIPKNKWDKSTFKNILKEPYIWLNQYGNNNSDFDLYFYYNRDQAKYYFYNAKSLEDQFQLVLNNSLDPQSMNLDLAVNTLNIELKEKDFLKIKGTYANDIRKIQPDEKQKIIHQLTNISDITDFHMAEYYYLFGIPTTAKYFYYVNRYYQINNDRYFWGELEAPLGKPSGFGYIVDMKNNKIIKEVENGNW